MAPSRAISASSEEEDAPESVPLSQSKHHAKQHDAMLKQIDAAEKDKKRMRNKERDRRLKEQAENSNRRRRENLGDAELEARMERAMQEAEAEMGEDGDDVDALDDSGDEQDEEFAGIDAASAEGSEDYSEKDEDSSEEEEEDEEMGTDEEDTAVKSKTNPNHLPDHLFTSAFSSKSAKAASKRKATDDVPTRKARKRVRSNAAPKDLVIGSRAIRSLASERRPAGTSTLPSAKVRKFLDRSLALKGGNAKTRGWERRPVNLGVMRRDGPAASFVRNR
ncbi:hypothetical protein LshimejAT787_0311360 [Lyophyllum shimeji]|uniref:Uncharacterized protein n=1 Tax=Lyophyllum shimeji TaxID=47721 RepID=A0A9P3UJD3_LYOSH|nr:hypothetical protein LshimejAT787_0311360 [Lyophyllum shimeji]